LLREHSKLYLLLKNLFFDRSETYFLHDYAHYRSPEVAATLTLLDSVVTRAQSGGITCSVLLLPYEYQLRTRDERYLLPQQIVTAFCRDRNIAVMDAYPAFAKDGGPSTAYFLYGDHMHLSARGHRIVFRLLSPQVRL
jgi:lysophospholipase L1-like esterase